MDYSYDLIQDRTVSRLGQDHVTRRDGMGWVAMGWDGMGWDGMEWNGVGMHLKVLRGCDAGLGWILLPLAPLRGAKVGSCFASSALERWDEMGWDGMG